MKSAEDDGSRSCHNIERDDSLYSSVVIFAGNPYPRPVNLPKTSYSKREGKKVGKAIQKMNEISRPVYIRSTDDAIKTADS